MKSKIGDSLVNNLIGFLMYLTKRIKGEVISKSNYEKLKRAVHNLEGTLEDMEVKE